MVDNNSVFLCGYISLNFNHRTIHPFGFTYISYLYPPFVPAFTFPVMFICPPGLADTPIPVLCTFPVIVVCVLYLIRFPFSPVAKTAPISPFGSASISPKIFNAALNLRTSPHKFPFITADAWSVTSIDVPCLWLITSPFICTFVLSPKTYAVFYQSLTWCSPLISYSNPSKAENSSFSVVVPPLHNLPVLIPCCILYLRERRASALSRQQCG